MNKSVIATLTLMLVLVGSAAAFCGGDCPPPPQCDIDSPNAYANAVVSSSGTTNPANAVGADDGQYAVIAHGGNLVLDMGEGEEIYNVFGVDMHVDEDNTQEKWVKIEVSDDLSTWKFVAWTDGSGDDNLELPWDVSKARYVKITNTDGFYNVEIDAVKAICTGQGNNVPEFGVLAAVGVLALAGLFVYKRRN